MGKNHIPCYLWAGSGVPRLESDAGRNEDNDVDVSAQQSHPAAQGLYFICEALCIMDVWATDTAPKSPNAHDDDDDVDENGVLNMVPCQADDCIRIGMHQRRDLRSTIYLLREKLLQILRIAFVARLTHTFETAERSLQTLAVGSGES